MIIKIAKIDYSTISNFSHPSSKLENYRVFHIVSKNKHTPLLKKGANL